VTFRTLDLGGDKVLPYVAPEREENPALGWRALRIGLDRPALLRYQLRALIAAAEGRRLRVMFPLVATAAEFAEARGLVDRELDWAARRGAQGPARLEVGAMLEAPSLVFAISALKGKADFLSVGTNDLMQYFFAADRNNPRVGERYDILSPPALSLLTLVCQEADASGLPVSVCGEAAGRPLEALALVGLGFRRLSMPASGIGRVKELIRSVHFGALTAELQRLSRTPAASVRADLENFARAHKIAL
jgi:phosphotransferase system enzyme I (PtsP)